MATIVNVIDNGDYTYRVSFSTDQFQLLLEEARSSGMTWVKEEKVWRAKQASCLSFLESVKDYSDIFPKGVLETVKKNEMPPERVELKTPFKRSLLARDPLPSKDGGISFQVEDIISGISQNVFALFLEQGMGKSFISLSILNHLREFQGVKNLLIVCEPTGIYNWRRYVLDECLGKIEKKDILIITKDNRELLGTNDFAVTICSFGTFRLCVDYFKKGKVKDPRNPVIPFKGNPKEWMLIVDESQNIGNHSSRQTKALLAHKSRFFFRYLLSGTPAINSPLKYYSQMEMLDSTIFQGMSFTMFQNRIANVGTKYNKYIVTGFKKDALPWLYDRMKPVMSRRKSEDFLLLPEHIVKKVYCFLPEKQEKIYNQILSSNLQKMKEVDGYLDARKVYNKFPYFHLALDNPTLLESIEQEGAMFPEIQQLVNSFSMERDHGKVIMLKDLLEKYIDEQDEKVVVWSGHPKTIDQLVKIFGKYNPQYIHGQVQGADSEYRDRVIEEWKTGKESKLLILSYLTSSTSINLTQAKHQIFFDRSYDAVYFDQAMKRLHRTGQTRDVTTEVLLFDETLDMRLDKNLEDKSNMDAFIFKKGKILSAKQWQDVFKGEKI